MMRSVNGASACSTALPGVIFVRTRTVTDTTAPTSSHSSYTDQYQYHCPRSALPPLSTADCQAVWCPCVVYSKNRQRMRHLQQHGAPLPGGGETFDKQCCIYAALIIPCYAWLMLVRVV